jgi:flavin-dependent dehydrogenase
MAGAGFLLVGDAAGLADAFWGDGIDTALVSGTLAAAHLASAFRVRDLGTARLAGYARSVERVLGAKLALGVRRQRTASIATDLSGP